MQKHRQFQATDWKYSKWLTGMGRLFPIVFLPFKIIVLGIGMYYAIKWHHDQAKKDNEAKGN